MVDIVKELRDSQLLVVCGHNKRLALQLSKVNWGAVHIFGLVNNMHEMMGAADVMITKPGGLSIAEALVRELPLIFFNAIPGQETHNIEVLKHYGIGLSGLSLPQMQEVIEEFSRSPQKILEAKQKMRELASPHAVKDIIDLIK